MLLGAALLLKERRADLRCPVKCIFQPAEEDYPGGAAPMIAGGVLDDVKSIFGMHICSDLASGSVGTRQGAFMSSVNRLRIRITGRGGHAASPAQCVDPVVAAANVILALQTVVSRSIEMTESAVVSITQIIAGTADNVIPGEVRLIGTIRTLDEAVRARVCDRVRRVAEGVAAAHGAEATVEAEAGYPVLMNDKDVTQRALRAAVHIGFSTDRIEVLEPRGGAEDFAYYCQKVPGAFVYLGARNPAKGCDHPHHHPRFNVDEDVLHVGAALHAQFCLEE
jgi:amidohydrolase